MILLTRPSRINYLKRYSKSLVAILLNLKNLASNRTIKNPKNNRKRSKLNKKSNNIKLLCKRSSNHCLSINIESNL